MARDKKKAEDGVQIVCRNRRALHDYEIHDTLECGLVLTGTEVKSLRAGVAHLEDSYAKIDGEEVWLVNSEIPEYRMGNRLNHKPRRLRKLLLHRREIAKFANRAYEQGLTLVPLKMYFKQGRAKLLLGLGRGRKLHDKRQKLKKADMQRDIQRAMRRG